MKESDMSRKKDREAVRGICYLAGAGPGDLGLVTLRVRELIERVEVGVFDYLCKIGRAHV